MFIFVFLLYITWSHSMTTLIENLNCVDVPYPHEILYTTITYTWTEIARQHGITEMFSSRKCPMNQEGNSAVFPECATTQELTPLSFPAMCHQHLPEGAKEKTEPKVIGSGVEIHINIYMSSDNVNFSHLILFCAVSEVEGKWYTVLADNGSMSENQSFF